MLDPMEEGVALMLDNAGIRYERNATAPDGVHQIDFYLPDSGVWVEVCQFYTERKIAQLGSLDNVILVQGTDAMSFLLRHLQGGK